MIFTYDYFKMPIGISTAKLSKMTSNNQNHIEPTMLVQLLRLDMHCDVAPGFHFKIKRFLHLNRKKKEKVTYRTKGEKVP